jgi:acyl-CoA reductase-like NAD-dependent aldehyde dehydrogenase
MNWVTAASAVQWRIQPFIDGRYRTSESIDLVENVNPATETTLCRVSVGNAADVDAAVRVARQRFNEGCWCDLPSGKRVEILLRLAQLVVHYKDEIALLDTLEMGKPITASIYDAEQFAPAVLRSCAGFADKLFGESAPLSSRMLAFNVYEPRGVVGAITAWNFPIVNAVIKVAPALAAGNSLVLKPSELTASSALKLAELALEAGVPEGVLNVVPGLGATVGAALALHPDVDLLSFTGSTATGRKLQELAGRSNGKPLLLECGGKSPQIVFDDVDDLDAVADATVQSAMWNQGQVCVARTRLLVHKDIKRALLDKVLTRAAGYVPGDPLHEATTFGPLASAAQRVRVAGYIEKGLKEGADAVLKGTIQEAGGCYVGPTIFDQVESSMSIAREEIFGPVLCVQSFATEAEALTLANETQYGLAATVWTRSMGCAKRMAHAIRAGSICIRSSGGEGLESPLLLSHEPQKASGFGFELGRHGLEAYSTLKAVTFVGN